MPFEKPKFVSLADEVRWAREVLLRAYDFRANFAISFPTRTRNHCEALVASKSLHFFS